MHACIHISVFPFVYTTTYSPYLSPIYLSPTHLLFIHLFFYLLHLTIQPPINSSVYSINPSIYSSNRYLDPLSERICYLRWLRRYSICLQCGRPRSNPWVGKISWRRKWQPTPVLLAGKSHGWRSLVGYSPWGRKESDVTEWLHLTSLLRGAKPHNGSCGWVIRKIPLGL